jgi:hypothetical protein
MRPSAPMRRFVPSRSSEVFAMAKHTVKLDLKTVERASNQFFDAFGRLMAEWAAIERALFLWFQGATQMSEPAARAVFYSARSFNARAEMLEAALPTAQKLKTEEAEFIKAALKRAWGYSGFRNSIVHGEPSPAIRGDAIQYFMIQGKHAGDAKVGRSISIEDMDTARENFAELLTCLYEVIPAFRPERATPKEYLQRILALPSQPYSKNTQRPVADYPRHPLKPRFERAWAGISQFATVNVASRGKLREPIPPLWEGKI